MPKRSGKKPSINLKRTTFPVNAKSNKEIVTTDLVQQTERAIVEFIKTDLQLGLTFVQSAQSYTDPQHVEHAIASAAEAHRTILEKLPKVHPNEQEKHWIDEKLKELKQALELLTKDRTSNFLS